MTMLRTARAFADGQPGFLPQGAEHSARFLRLRVGAWGPRAKALRYEWDSIQKVATGKRAVTPALAPRVARLAGITMDELLAGQWLSPRVYPHCGHPPEDFVDEETVVE
jgi:hypothetical protein